LDPVLLFDLPANHLPARPSTLRGLEQSVVALASSIPVVMKRLESLLLNIETDLDEMDLPQTSSDLREFLNVWRVEAEALDLGAAQRGFSDTLADLSRTAEAIEAAANQAQRGEGAIGGAMVSVDQLAKSARVALTDADLPRLVAALTKVADGLDGLGPDARVLLGDTRVALRGLQQSLSAWTSLLRQLEHDPAALVRGRTQTNPFEGSDD
jgi:ABC-type transporter Mla subunit MlaD